MPLTVTGKVIRALRLGITALLVSALLAGCQTTTAVPPAQQGAPPGQGSQPANPEPLKIGVLAPATGPFASGGAAMVQSLRLAAEELNRQGGVLGRQVVLVTADSQGKADVARTEALRLIERDKVWALIGAYLTESTAGAMEAAADQKVILVVPVAASNEITAKVAENYARYRHVFRVSYNINQWAQLMGGYVESLGIKKYAFAGTNIRWNHEYAQALKDLLGSKGITQVYEGYYSPQEPALGAMLKAVRDAGPELLVLGDPGKGSIEFVKQARTTGLKLPLFSVGGALGDARVAKTLEPGGYLSFQAAAWRGSNPRATQYFNDFQQKYNYQPVGYSDTLPHEALTVLAQAIAQAGSLDTEKVVQALESGEFRGISGTYRFDASHQAQWGAAQGLQGVVVRWKDGTDQIVWPKGR